jgi:hypothetical protein
LTGTTGAFYFAEEWKALVFRTTFTPPIEMSLHFSGQEAGILQTFYYCRHGNCANLRAVLVNGCKRHRQKARVLYVIHVHNAHLVWNAYSQSHQGVHQPCHRYVEAQTSASGRALSSILRTKMVPRGLSR